MFSAFGSIINDDLETGLIESFTSHNYSDSTNNCYIDGGKIMCRNDNVNSQNNTTTQVDEDSGEETGSNNTPTQNTFSPQPTQPRVIRQFPDNNETSITEQFQNRTQQSQDDESSSESSSSESDSDPELEEADNEDAVQRKSEGNNARVRAMYKRERPQTTPAVAAVDNQDDPEATSAVEDESDDDETTESTGPSVTKEDFSNMKSISEKATSSNLILKGVLFSCVFYILIHDETRKKLMNHLTKSVKFLKSQHYEYISVIIFFILYYIISIFL